MHVDARPMPVAGAVLVGGASRRMGRPKALIEVDGSPMVVRVAAALSAGGCAPVRLIGGLATLPDDVGYPRRRRSVARRRSVGRRDHGVDRRRWRRRRRRVRSPRPRRGHRPSDPRRTWRRRGGGGGGHDGPARAGARSLEPPCPRPADGDLRDRRAGAPRRARASRRRGGRRRSGGDAQRQHTR